MCGSWNMIEAKNSRMQNRISKTDSAMIRGIAVLFVIIAHYAQWYVTMEDSGIISTVLTKLGRYGVSIFFAVSGYGLLCSATKGVDRSFLKRRVLNVYLPYVMISGIVRLLSGATWRIGNIVKWVLGLNAWFVFNIMIFYLIFYVGYKYCKHKIVAIEIGVFLVSVLLAVIVKDSVWYASNISFGVGILAKVYEERIAEYSKPVFLGSVVGGFIVSAVIYMLAMNRNEFVYIFFKVIASGLWSILILGILIDYKIARIKVLEVVGTISLECYLIHHFILDLFTPLTWEPLLVCSISVVITIFCSFVIHSMITTLIHWMA